MKNKILSKDTVDIFENIRKAYFSGYYNEIFKENRIKMANDEYWPLDNLFESTFSPDFPEKGEIWEVDFSNIPNSAKKERLSLVMVSEAAKVENEEELEDLIEENVKILVIPISSSINNLPSDISEEEKKKYVIPISQSKKTGLSVQSYAVVPKATQVHFSEFSRFMGILPRTDFQKIAEALNKKFPVK